MYSFAGKEYVCQGLKLLKLGCDLILFLPDIKLFQYLADILIMMLRINGPACNSIKEETLALVFSCEFCKISKNTFFTEHLWTTAFEMLAF